MDFKLAQFLVIDPDFNCKKGQYTISGLVIFPVGSAIPIIKKGRGCIGIADIKSFKVTEGTTTVTFKYQETTKDSASAYYDLFLINTNSSESASGDFYDNTDQLIPGAMGLKPSKSSSNDTNKRRKSRFYDEDDLDW